MALEDRVIVAKFSYSSLKTLPEVFILFNVIWECFVPSLDNFIYLVYFQEVPAHLKTSAYHIPKQTNEFLLHLLQVPAGLPRKAKQAGAHCAKPRSVSV